MLRACGAEKVLHNTRFQKEREAWITALFLAALNKVDQKSYWVGVEESDRTPDTYGVMFREMGKGLSKDVMNIEVCEWESHSKLGMSDHIKAKLKKARYPGYFILLCYVHGQYGRHVDLEAEYQKIIAEKFDVAEIFLLGSQVNPKFDHILAKLYPGRFKVEFNRLEEVNRLQQLGQQDIMKPHRGFGTDIEELGTMEIEWPSCE